MAVSPLKPLEPILTSFSAIILAFELIVKFVVAFVLSVIEVSLTLPAEFIIAPSFESPIIDGAFITISLFPVLVIYSAVTTPSVFTIPLKSFTLVFAKPLSLKPEISCAPVFIATLLPSAIFIPSFENIFPSILVNWLAPLLPEERPEMSPQPIPVPLPIKLLKSVCKGVIVIKLPTFITPAAPTTIPSGDTNTTSPPI